MPMDIAQMSTKRHIKILGRGSMIPPKYKLSIPPTAKVAMRRYQRTGKMKEKVEASLMVLMQQNGFMIITPE